MEILQRMRDRRLCSSGRRGRHRRSKFARALLALMLIVLASGASAQAAALGQPGPQPVRVESEGSFPRPGLARAPARPAAQGTTRIFKAIADADVREGLPAQNHGIAYDMSIGYDNYPPGNPGNPLTQIALLRFEISSHLPPGTTIHSARLALALIGSCDIPGATAPIMIDRLSGEWSEMGVDWNHRPPTAEAYGPYGVGTYPGGSELIWYSFDITNLARGWVDGTYAEYGLALRGPDSPAAACGSRTFLTKGGGGFASSPQLAVDYTLPAPALAVAQQQLRFFVQCGAGAPAPAPQTITLRSNSAKLASWTAAVLGDSSWVSLSKTGDKVSWIFPDQIAVSVRPPTPCNVTRTAQIQISALGGTRTVTVVMQPAARWIVRVPLALKNAAGNAALPMAAASPPRIGLLIGIADYQYLDPPAAFSLYRSGAYGTDIYWPGSDREQVQRTLAATLSVLIALTEENATMENIQFALKRMAEIAPPDAEILVYFSGHGAQEPDAAPIDEADGKDEVLGPYDINATQAGFANAFPDDALKQALAGFGTRHLALILDSCNSGGIEVSNPHRAVLAASLENQLSIEADAIEHGVFTYFFLKALLDPAADTNHDGWISVHEAYEYARQKVEQYVSTNFGEHQTIQQDITADFNLVKTP